MQSLPRTQLIVPPWAALVAANAAVLLGVLFGQWDVYQLVLLYWLENVAIGLFGVLKILLVGPPFPKDLPPKEARIAPFLVAVKIVCALVFAFAFSWFTMMHGVFIIVMLGGARPAVDNPFTWNVAFQGAMSVLRSPGFVVVLALMFVGHGWSYVIDYIRRRERYHANIHELMAAPFARVIALHVFIIGGGWVILGIGPQSVLLLLMFVAMKTGADIAAHFYERRRARRAKEADDRQELESACLGAN